MADYIDREELIKAIMNDKELLDTYGTDDRWEETIKKINSMPSLYVYCSHYDKGYGDVFNDGRKAVIAEIIEQYGDEVTE